MSVQLTIDNPTVGGGAVSTLVANDYATPAAAIAAISNNFLEVAQPGDGGEARALNIDFVKSIAQA